MIDTSLETRIAPIGRKLHKAQKKVMARKLYFEHFCEPMQIHRLTRVPLSTIYFWVFGNRYKNPYFEKKNPRKPRKVTPIEETWKYQRDLISKQLAEEYFEKKDAGLRTIMAKTIEQIMGAVLHRANLKDPRTGLPKHLEMEEVLQGAKLLETINKIYRLEQNKPTEIVQNEIKPITAEELKQAVMADPFIDVTPKENERGPRLSETSTGDFELETTQGTNKV